MRLYILIIVSFFILNLPAQYKYGTNLNDSALLTVTSKKGFLYAGMDNILKLNIRDTEFPDNFKIATNNGMAFLDNTEIIAIPSKAGPARISLQKVKNSDTLFTGYKNFFVVTIPDPKLRIDTLVFAEKDVVRKSYLAKSDSLGIFFSNDIAGSENWFRIENYSIGFIYGGVYREYAFTGNKLSKVFRDLIYKVGPNKEIIFKVKVRGEGNLSPDMPIFRLMTY